MTTIRASAESTVPANASVVEIASSEVTEKSPAKPSSQPTEPPWGAIKVSLSVLAILAIIYTLHWGRAFFIPLMFGIIISYALSPIVNRMQRWRVPRAVGAAVLLVGILGGISTLVYSLSDEATATLESMPEAARKFRKALEEERIATDSTMEKVKEATAEIMEAAKDLPITTDPEKGVTRVQIENPKIDFQTYLLAGTVGVFGITGQIAMVLFLAYFLIVSGDSFRRKMIKVSGDRLSQKRITLNVLDDINEQIQRYLLSQVLASVLVGIATWLAFLTMGVENAAIWGVAAAILNTIPYLGAVFFSIATALVAFLQFGTLGMAVFVSGVGFLITSLEGLLLTPWLISRTNQTNAVVVFVGVLFWGWLWGVWGLLLGIPILMAIKAVCDHVEEFRSVGELLGK